MISSCSLQNRCNFGNRVLSIFLVKNYCCHLWFLQQWKAGERNILYQGGEWQSKGRRGGRVGQLDTCTAIYQWCNRLKFYLLGSKKRNFPSQNHSYLMETLLTGDHFHAKSFLHFSVSNFCILITFLCHEVSDSYSNL